MTSYSIWAPKNLMSEIWMLASVPESTALAHVGLGHADGRVRLTLDERRNPALLLLGGSELLYHQAILE
ncbi:MAG TPA: hypothetical protein VMR14_09945 [Streptosporangiaceae bacterium]|jgi:hypothetical protein|nr:hypothetical protein [Streptosporangiaceae bacterium]